jgi:hypothetical protein
MNDGRKSVMPSPCTVCLRVDRAAIDRRLVHEGVNLAALARTLGVGRKALERHRNGHVSALLARVHDKTATLSASPLNIQLVGRYDATRDALASAQRAALSRNDVHHPSHAVSNAAIVELVDRIAERLDSLTELFLDAAEEQNLALPPDPEERARIRRALNSIMERSKQLSDTA